MNQPMTHVPPAARVHTRIEPPRGWTPVSLPEMWQHRDLLFYLVVRDLRSITSSTSLGFYWLLLQPLAFALVLTVVLGFLVKVPTGNMPYALVVLSGLLPWTYVNNSIARASSSMVANAHLLTKVYFPRLIIPVVPIVSGLIDFGVVFLVLLAAVVYFGIAPTWQWLLLPLPVLLAIGLALGAGLWLCALTVRFRDVANMVPVLLQLGTYVSPVFYPRTLVPQAWLPVYDLNPMVGIIEATRWSLLSLGPFPSGPVSISAIVVLILIGTGVFYFRVTEDIAADIV